jgi:tRNA 2-thiouridine synthesizing protein A
MPRQPEEPSRTVDARGLRCPLPLIKARNEIDLIESGQILEVLATDPGADHDFQAWSKRARHEIVDVSESETSETEGTVYRFLLRKA